MPGQVHPIVMLCSLALLAPLEWNRVAVSRGGEVLRLGGDGGAADAHGGGDASLVEWLRRALAGAPAARLGGRGPRLLFALYVLVQLLLPLRMPLVSGHEWARTGLGYRWSWAMGLHHTQHFFEYEVPLGSRVPQPAKMWKSNDGVTLTELKGPAPLRVALSLFYFVPTCAGRGVIPRWAYLPATNLPEHDARTLPLELMLQAANPPLPRACHHP